MILKAKCPILYGNRQYEAGDVLPAFDLHLVDAWLDAGTAAWVGDEAPQPQPAKAKLVTAEPGKPGLSDDGDPDALVGKIPTRKRKK